MPSGAQDAAAFRCARLLEEPLQVFDPPPTQLDKSNLRSLRKSEFHAPVPIDLLAEAAVDAR
jgi:hypothetical protein